MTPVERMLIERECERLSASFAHLNDARRFAELAELFAEDGIFIRPLSGGRPLVGRGDILAEMSGKPASLVTRHLCLNTLITVDSASRAHGVTSFMTLAQRDADSDRLPIAFTGKTFVGEFLDEFVLGAHGWKIARREGRICFDAGSAVSR